MTGLESAGAVCPGGTIIFMRAMRFSVRGQENALARARVTARQGHPKWKKRHGLEFTLEDYGNFTLDTRKVKFQMSNIKCQMSHLCDDHLAAVFAPIRAQVERPAAVGAFDRFGLQRHTQLDEVGFGVGQLRAQVLQAGQIRFG